jgi:hypothetical protein
MKKNLERRPFHRWALGLSVIVVAIVGELVMVRQAVAAPPSRIDPRRSLVVTDLTILARFPLERVLNQLVYQSRIPGLTALELFHQWWDTQNPRPGQGFGLCCDDTVDATGSPVINGFPYSCRPAPSEGVQASTDPFADPDSNLNAYLPVGLFNRFDLAPSDGSHCGEYRIVYAKRSGMSDALARNLVIFEAVLPNPHPKQGLKGCKKIVNFWAGLTQLDDVNQRADQLESFYFYGSRGVPPVVHVDHYGGNGASLGQVRTNQFLKAPAFTWSLREFKLVRSCSGKVCTALRFIPVTDKSNPFGPLFQPNATHPEAGNFQEFFPTQVEGLAAGSLTAIDAEAPDAYNTAQSQASGTTENDYAAQFSAEPSALRASIQAQLAALGSSLTPDEIVLRAQALSCAGCHRFNNNVAVGGGLIWPSSLGFTHVTERETETIDGQLGFRISPALVAVFLPHRQQILENYLNNKPLKTKKPKDPIGVFRVH